MLVTQHNKLSNGDKGITQCNKLSDGNKGGLCEIFVDDKNGNRMVRRVRRGRDAMCMDDSRGIGGGSKCKFGNKSATLFLQRNVAGGDGHGC